MFRRRSRRTDSSAVTARKRGAGRAAGAAGVAGAGGGGAEANSGDAGPAPVVTVTDANFFDVTAGGYTLVDFWAPWCGPCRTFAPIFQSAARKHGERVRFGSCNVDQNRRTASLLGVMSIPTLVVFGPDGSEVGRHTGLLSPRALDQLTAQLPV